MAEKGISRIKLQKQIAEGVDSPLVYLRNKELELQGKIMEAKKEVEIIVAEARRKTAEIKRVAQEEATIEAQKYYQQEMGKTRKEAEEIRKGVKVEIEKVKKEGEKNLQKGIDLVLKIVIPKVKE